MFQSIVDRHRRGTKSACATNPSCSTMSQSAAPPTPVMIVQAKRFILDRRCVGSFDMEANGTAKIERAESSLPHAAIPANPKGLKPPLEVFPPCPALLPRVPSENHRFHPPPTCCGERSQPTGMRTPNAAHETPTVHLFIDTPLSEALAAATE